MTDNGRQRRRARRAGSSDAGSETPRARGRHEADEPTDDDLEILDTSGDGRADDPDDDARDAETDDVDDVDEADEDLNDDDRDAADDDTDDDPDRDSDDVSPAERRRRRAARASVASRGTATSTRTRTDRRRSAASTTTSGKTATKAPARSAGGGGIGRFLREVFAELGKVIWPGRKQLITYTVVVLVFVSIMVALIAGLDFLFAQGVIAVFG